MTAPRIIPEDPTSSSPAHRLSSNLQVLVAATITLIVFVGFSRTFYLASLVRQARLIHVS